MNLSERHRGILLFATPFCAVALLAFYVLQTARGETSRPVTRATRRSTPAQTTPRPSPPADDSDEDFQIISRRNIFRPLIAPKKVKVQRSIHHYVPPTNLKPLQPLIPPMPIPRAPQTKTPGQLPPPTSPTNGIAVVGTVNVNGVMHGVVEDITRHETRFIRVGEEAFGFRLTQIDDERAVLERDGKRFVLNLGANKEDKPVRPPAKPQPAAEKDFSPSAVILNNQVQAQGGTPYVQPK